MSIEIRIPKVGESISEVQISEWLKSAGDQVRKDEPLAIIDSEKTTFELPATDSGIPRQYDVSPDGKRFLMLKDSAAGDPSATPARMVVVEHWFEELKQRVTGK